MKGFGHVVFHGHLHAFGKERTYGGKRTVDICVAMPAGFSRVSNHSIVNYVWVRVKGWGLEELKNARQHDLIFGFGMLYSHTGWLPGTKTRRKVDQVKIAARFIRIISGKWVDWERIAERYRIGQAVDPNTLYQEAAEEPDTVVELVDATQYVEEDNTGKLMAAKEVIVDDTQTLQPASLAALVEEALRGSGRGKD